MATTLPSVLRPRTPARRPRRGMVSPWAVPIAVVAALAAGPSTGPSEPPTDPSAFAGAAWCDPGEPFRLGVTFDQHHLETWQDPQIRAVGSEVLAATPVFQNQYLMGWGALNPEPAPGQYDWASLERRVDGILATGGTPVLTLAGAPDWMKGGAVGETDWDRLLEAPAPEHVDDFAALAAATARHFPEVRHFLVWSELKGFWDPARGAWDIEAYTDLYNAVYTALKDVDPTLQVGGPYLEMTSWSPASGVPTTLRSAWGGLDTRVADAVDYWLEHNVGADMLVVDGGSHPKDVATGLTADAAMGKFGDVTRWLRGRTDLPIWWVEVHPFVDPGDRDDPVAEAEAMESAMTELADAGASTGWLWSPEQFAHFGAAGLWTGATFDEPGRVTTLGERWHELSRRLAVPGRCALSQAIMPAV